MRSLCVLLAALGTLALAQGPALPRPSQPGPEDKPAFPSPPEGFDSVPERGLAGRVETFEYHSNAVGFARKAEVYLPPGYSAARRYPVLFLLHGFGGNERVWRMAGRADAILDNLIRQGKAQPMVVVMPNGRASLERELANPLGGDVAGDFARFERDLVEDLLPAVEARYSVRRDREGRAIAGLSMGGGQALNVGLGRSDLFAWVGAMAPAGNARPFESLVPKPAELRLRLLWLSCGDRDVLLGLSQAWRRRLKEAGVEHVWHVGPGIHSFAVWRADLYWLAQRLFR
ncbi:MAG: alpha/beta hydrolase-fold protein [Fimbriimonadales bacterium]|nr:alpha/beta hydrolase-fold protein [Fimbriimonadales bacterium]